MKKSTLSIVLMLSAFCSYAQVKDTIYSENKVNAVWVKNGLDVITSNAQCATATDLFMAWNSLTESYINTTLTTNSFNDAGVIDKQTTQSWDASNGIWINTSRAIYTYSSDNMYFTNVGQGWDAATSTWYNSYRILVEYNPDGTVKTSEFDYSDGINWLKQARTFNTYDALKRVTEFLYQSYINNEWVNGSRVDYNYSGNGLSFSYYWDSFSSKWVKSQKTFSNYIGTTAVATKQLYQYYTGIEWINQSRNKATYNDNYLTTSNAGQNWDAGLQNWINSFRVSEDYYDDGSQQHFSFESWDIFTNSWSSGYRATLTNNACGSLFEFAQPVEVSDNNKSILNKRGYDLNSSLQTKNTNNINRQLNIQMSNGKTSVYDFTYNAGKKQMSFQLTRNPLAKQQAIKTTNSNNIVQQGNNKVLISPNPARNYFTLNLTGYKAQENLMLKLSDVSGKNIMQQKVQAGSVQNINLPHLQKGLYIVTIISGRNIDTQKLMVE